VSRTLTDYFKQKRQRVKRGNAYFKTFINLIGSGHVGYYVKIFSIPWYYIITQSKMPPMIYQSLETEISTLLGSLPMKITPKLRILRF